MVLRPLLPALSPFPCSLIHSHATFPPCSHSSAYWLISLCQNVSSPDITWGLQGMWSQVLIPSCSACLGLELGSRELTGCVSTGLQGLRWQKQRARETTRSTTAGPASRGRLGLTDAPRPMSPPLTSSSGGLRTPAHHLPRLLASWVKHLSFFHQKKKRSFLVWRIAFCFKACSNTLTATAAYVWLTLARCFRLCASNCSVPLRLRCVYCEQYMQ